MAADKPTGKKAAPKKAVSAAAKKAVPVKADKPDGAPFCFGNKKQKTRCRICPVRNECK